MPLSNDADDRRGVRNGRSKAAARTRRRASAPYLEGLESRALLSTVQGPGRSAPRCRRRGAQYVPGEVLIQVQGRVSPTRCEPGCAGGSVGLPGRATAMTTGPLRDAGGWEPWSGSIPPGRSVEARIRALEGQPGRRVRRAELDLHAPGDLQRPLLHRTARSGACTATPPRPGEPVRQPGGRGLGRRQHRLARRLRRRHRRGDRLQPPRPGRQHLDQPVRSRSTASTTTATATSTTSTAGTSATTTTRSTTAARGRPRHARRRHHRRPGRQRPAWPASTGTSR